MVPNSREPNDIAVTIRTLPSRRAKEHASHRPGLRVSNQALQVLPVLR